MAIIHGPPGTGKTTTVVELIRQAVRRGDKVLVCAPSNLAVDNLLERLLALGEQAVRLGHPARVLPQLREHTLDLMVEDHADVRLARKFVKEAFALFRQAEKWTRAKPEPGASRDLRQEAQGLLADARKLEDAGGRAHPRRRADPLRHDDRPRQRDFIGQRRFDLLVIDEACQTTEPGCWIPLLCAATASCWPAITASCRRRSFAARRRNAASASACSSGWSNAYGDAGRRAG